MNNAQSNTGYVYVLTNPAMPGLVKIGRSKTAAAGRARTMYSGDTGVPLPFDIYFECLFDDCIAGEQAVHDELCDYRINPNREFFRIEPGDAAVAVMRVRAYDEHHTVICAEFQIDESVYHILAYELGCHPFSIASAFDEITADELRPAHLRRIAKTEQWIKENRTREEKSDTGIIPS